MPAITLRATPALLLPLALLLASCGGGETPDPAGLSRDEAEALNDAAEMLDSMNNGQVLFPTDPQ